MGVDLIRGSRQKVVGLLKKEGRVGFGFYKKMCHSSAVGGVWKLSKSENFSRLFFLYLFIFKIFFFFLMDNFMAAL